MSIKAIETHYKGYRFRSRLEARWAVFFDALGLQWEYEPEGYDLGEAGWYLPDFRVKTPQGSDCWYDVKPKGTASNPKVSAFAERLYGQPDENGAWAAVSVRVGILAGDPLDVLEREDLCPRCGLIGKVGNGSHWDHGEVMVGCEACDFETPSGGDNDDETGFLGTTCRPHKGWIIAYTPEWVNRVLPFVRQAAHMARSARFEHGESGVLRRA